MILLIKSDFGTLKHRKRSVLRKAMSKVEWMSVCRKCNHEEASNAPALPNWYLVETVGVSSGW